jgi:hypothetical protein
MIEKIRLVPSNRRIWLGCIASSLLVGMGCLVVHNGNKFGWFLIILFGLGVLAPALLLRPGASWLELDEEGFTLCLSYRPDRYLWRHITDIAVWRGVVSFKLDPEHRGDKRGQTTARAISGYDGSIPNIFRLHPQSLLEVMMKFKQP